MKLINDDGLDFVDITCCRQLVGSLIYLANTKPNISFTVGKVARYMTSIRHSRWFASKKILIYIQGTWDHG